ncbi:DUF1549 and DUF1553 domain-containing protein [Thalassoroseus pseudoceratinae]|uniref:DUF1549 and DUF1553 domain-containing protein n=1 Tax=Thalassoroseus pseudoceratinae TaxID=2713176 RepID=UPI0014215A2E|nr:DUF1549 and DUF1553 domain-containing protein [Thalassoroseus pseudoceratinae]
MNTMGTPRTFALGIGMLIALSSVLDPISLNADETTINAPEGGWSFRNHVLPILSRYGCNSGACHGALAGKGGFKLSLRGYDPDRDHYVITRQARGRRIAPRDPGRSLLLAKPTGAIPHKGGLRFEPDSSDYRILADWISAGAPSPKADDPRLKKLEVLPNRITLKPQDEQPLTVRAHYTDGRVEDVTRWAMFTSTNEAVCRVNDEGVVNVVGSGEGAVTVWFSSQISVARMTVPYDQNISAEVYTTAERHNFIDDLVLKKLKELNLKPSPLADDATFLRRAYIDTIGTLPTANETRDFLADTSPDKRDRLIDHLLARPEFNDYWTLKWSDILLLSGTKLRPKALETYYQWIHSHVERNTPWDEFVREIVTAQGSSYENGATNFYSLHQTPEDMTENVSQAFLGLSIACAKCHNHPLEKWTNNQYYAMANLFARVRTKGWGGDSRNGDGLRTLYVATSGDLVQPLTGKPQPPTPLDGEPLPFDDPGDRREQLADWLTSPENPYFSRSIANRVWANFMNVGLVESVDDMRKSNPASNEELLDALANHLVENDFDLKSLMRTILQSATYQRSSQPLPENEDEQRYYSRYYPERMMAEVLLDGISQVTSVPTQFKEIEFPGADVRKTDFYKPGTRAIALYDSAVRSYFLKTFGRNPRDITCECERSEEPSMVQVLHLSNGDTVNEKLRANDSRVTQLLNEKKSSDEIVETVYLSALSRLPTVREREQLTSLIEAAPEQEKRTAIEDLFWAVLTSKEFLFSH